MRLGMVPAPVTQRFEVKRQCRDAARDGARASDGGNDLKSDDGVETRLGIALRHRRTDIVRHSVERALLADGNARP